jgi:hypothetical protein
MIPHIIHIMSTVFWEVTPCNLVYSYVSFRGMHYLYLQGRRLSQASSKHGLLFNPDDHGFKFLRNIG